MTERKARPIRPANSTPHTDAFSAQPPLREGGTPAVIARVFFRDCLNTSEANRMGLNPPVACRSCSQLKGNAMPSENIKTVTRPIRFIRLPEILAQTGLSKMTINRMEQEGLFPLRRKIGKHAIAWVESEIDEWCEKRAAGKPWGDSE